MVTTDVKYYEEYGHERHNRRNSAITTALIMLLLLLALIILGLYRQNPPPGEKGIAVVFGTTDQGMGDEASTAIDPDITRTPEEVTETETQPEVTEPTPTIETPMEEVVTQQHEEAPVVAPSKPKTTPTKPVETPKEPTKPVEQPKKDPTPEPGSTFGGFKGNQNNAGSKGNDNIPGDKGKPNGTGTNWDGDGGSGNVPGGTGNGYGLTGRSPLKRIEPDSKKEAFGTVRVRIVVNSTGKVISATYDASNSTTTDSYLKQISIEAALKWEWSADPQNRPEQIGFIDFKYAPK